MFLLVTVEWQTSGHTNPQSHLYALPTIRPCDLPEQDLRAMVRDKVGSARPAIYESNSAEIMYIHGSSTKPNDRLSLGHGWQRKPEDSFLYGRDPEEVDTRELQGNQILDQYFEATFKSTARIIKENLPFFGALRNVNEVWVMGHSLESVDLPYFHEITRHIDVGRTHWKVSYYLDGSRIRPNVDQLELPRANVTFAFLEQF